MQVQSEELQEMAVDMNCEHFLLRQRTFAVLFWCGDVEDGYRLVFGICISMSGAWDMDTCDIQGAFYPVSGNFSRVDIQVCKRSVD